jgi:hypothetical protein
MIGEREVWRFMLGFGSGDRIRIVAEAACFEVCGLTTYKYNFLLQV